MSRANGSKKKNTRQFKADTKIYSDKLGIYDWELTEEQCELSEMIDNNVITFVQGRSGSGKTSSVLHNYVSEYLQDKYKQIVIIKTPVEAGLDKIGALPAGLTEKTELHFVPYREILEELLNKEKLQCDTNKRIHFKIPNFAIGCTFKDSLVLISEAQQLPPLILKLLLERLGEGSKAVVEGDASQLYTYDAKRGGLSHAIKVFFDKDEDGNMTLKDKEAEGKIGYYKFPNNTNVRSDIVRIVNNNYENIGM